MSVIRNRVDQNGCLNYASSTSTRRAQPDDRNAFRGMRCSATSARIRSERRSDRLPSASRRSTFVTDNWRLAPFTFIDVGMRYRLRRRWSQANNVTNFDPSLYDPAQAVTVLPNGTLAVGSGNRNNGLIRGGVTACRRSAGARAELHNDPAVTVMPATRRAVLRRRALASRRACARVDAVRRCEDVDSRRVWRVPRSAGRQRLLLVGECAAVLQTVRYDNGNLANPRRRHAGDQRALRPD